MQKINIIGAGQSGLQLALSLLEYGYDVTVYGDRTAEDIASGSVMSTQCMFDSSLQTERAHGLNLWDESCPDVEGIMLNIAGGQPAPVLAWGSQLDQPGQSVDQRVKFPAWMKLFQERGGKLVHQGMTPEDLDTLDGDLTIVAAGKGAIAGLFPRDAEKSPYETPQRVLALSCVKNLTNTEPYNAVSFNIVPGQGEYFVIPGITHSGPCHFLIMEAIPGGQLDRWDDVKTPAEHWARMQELLQEFIPWEAKRAENATLTDDKAVLRGRFTPTVRHPVATLPSGKPVLGMADVVVLNDPITGQGSNNAAKCAAVYLQRILDHGDRPFDAAWMQETFDTYWDYAQFVTGWTNAMLMPPPPHVMSILGAAGSAPGIAHKFVNGFDDPRTFFPWIADPDEANKMIAEHMAV